jgi:hypothetical protein
MKVYDVVPSSNWCEEPKVERGIYNVRSTKGMQGINNSGLGLKLFFFMDWHSLKSRIGHIHNLSLGYVIIYIVF